MPQTLELAALNAELAAPLSGNWSVKLEDPARSVMTDFTEQTNAETESGSLTWLMAAMEFPSQPAEVHGYGTVIGTGNAVVEWRAQ